MPISILVAHSPVCTLYTWNQEANHYYNVCIKSGSHSQPFLFFPLVTRIRDLLPCRSAVVCFHYLWITKILLWAWSKFAFTFIRQVVVTKSRSFPDRIREIDSDCSASAQNMPERTIEGGNWILRQAPIVVVVSLCQGPYLPAYVLIKWCSTDIAVLSNGASGNQLRFWR